MLQLKEDSKNSYYITFQSDADVKAHYDAKGGTVAIKFMVDDTKQGEDKQYTYHLRTAKEIDTIDVYINEEQSSFDIIS